MRHATPSIELDQQQFLSTGTVVTTGSDGYRIAFGPGHRPATTRAVSAMNPPVELGVGDKVLVAGGSDGASYILGCPQQLPSTKTVRAGDGETIRVEDSAGRLLFEHDGEAQRTTVAVPEGDLVLSSSTGGVRLAAGSTELRLSPGGLTLHADKAEIDIDETTFRGRAICGVAKRAKWVYEKLETVAARLFERTKNTYRQSEQLHQTKAGRMRTLVEGDLRVRSGHTDHRSSGDVRIDGEHIHLG